jgi:hypothetical protein
MTGSAVRVPEGDNPVNSLRDVVLSYFYPVSGTVVGVSREAVTISVQTEHSLKNGIRLSVYREGKPYYHPVTKEQIGRTESRIGRIEINGMQSGTTRDHPGERLYTCRVIKGSPVVGDIVRVSSSIISLAFFQDKKADWTISEMFYASLRDSGRFRLLESYTTTYERGELAQRARDLGAEAVMLFSTPAKNEKMFLKAQLIWPEDGSVFAEFEEIVEPSIARGLVPEDELIALGSIEGEPWGQHKLVGGELMAMGDVDGNRGRELVVSDGNDIRIYNYEDELREAWVIKGNRQARHISLDVLDFNKNGIAEIFVTSLTGDDFDSDISDGVIMKKKNVHDIVSFVIEYDPSEGYRRIWERAPYALRVVGTALLMQGFTPNKALSGPVYRGIWKDGHYETGTPLELPDDVGIYGFTYVDWDNSGRPHVLAFDDKGYLRLYSGGELLWNSKESYGRFDMSFEKKTYSVVQTDEEWVVKGRLIPVKTNRGQEALVVKRIPFLSKLPGLGYKKAEVYSIWWDGEIMDESMVMGGVYGSVTDYWLEGNNLLLLARPNFLVSLKTALAGDFVKGSLLYYYNLTGE